MDRKYVKVLAMMQARPEGRIAVNDPELVKFLGSRHRDEDLGAIAYRVPNYMSDIRRYAKLDVDGIREGRMVIAYQLTAVNTVSEPPASEAPAANV